MEETERGVNRAPLARNGSSTERRTNASEEPAKELISHE